MRARQRRHRRRRSHANRAGRARGRPRRLQQDRAAVRAREQRLLLQGLVAAHPRLDGPRRRDRGQRVAPGRRVAFQAASSTSDAVRVLRSDGERHAVRGRDAFRERRRASRQPAIQLDGFFVTRLLRRERRRRAAASVCRSLYAEHVHGDRRDVHRDFVPVHHIRRAVEPAPRRVEALRLGERHGRVRGVERPETRGLVEVVVLRRGVRRDVGGDRRFGRDARAVVGSYPPASLARHAAAVHVPSAKRERRRPRGVRERHAAPVRVVGHVPHAVVIGAQQQKRSLRREVVGERRPARAVVRGPLPRRPSSGRRSARPRPGSPASC